MEGRSGSIERPDHWWYQARERMMRSVFADVVGPGATVLEVGSADGPSTAWLAEGTRRIATDIDVAGLRPGDVCADITRLPFVDDCFDVVGAFDVLEHVEHVEDALGEIARVLRPSGHLLVSVPAYTWAWTEFDVRAGHHRRYTSRRLRAELSAGGFEVLRCTHAFAGTLPLFAADRLRARLTGRAATGVGDGDPPRALARLLGWLGRLDAALLRRVDLPAGSSVFALARRHGHGPATTQERAR